jgi:hypothetical protein
MAKPGLLVVTLLAVVLLMGCTHTEESSIAPLTPTAGRVDPGLGPGTRALSFGPGYKGSPSWNPNGTRIAFTVDGYVVDGPTTSGEPRRWTTKDFLATDTEWTSDDTLAILGTASSERGAEGSLYRANAGEGSLALKGTARRVLAMSPIPGEHTLVFAFVSGPHESKLALTRDGGTSYKSFAYDPIEGRVSALSLSPDGDEAVMAVRPRGDSRSSEVRTFDFRQGEGQVIVRLEGHRELVGTPQWTQHGIYFVAGKQAKSVDDDGSEPRTATRQNPRPAWERTSSPRASASPPRTTGWP